MFFDEVIAFLALIFEAFLGLVVWFLNLVIGLIELIVGLFVSGFKLKRIYRKQDSLSTKQPSKFSLWSLGLSIVAAVLIIFVPMIVNRTVTFVANDGRALPFAAVLVRSGDNEELSRTSRVGELTISRFKVDSLTIVDPRYVETTWQQYDIESELTVERSLTGKALSAVTQKLFSSLAKEGDDPKN